MSDLLNGGSPSVLRGLNLRSALRHVRDKGPVTKADLIRLTGLSRPTINEIVSDLLGLGILAEGGVPPTGKAGSRVHYDFNASRGCLVGVDLGSRKTIILVSDLAGEILARKRVPTEHLLPLGPGTDSLRAHIFEALREAGHESPDVMHATICTPGVVDRETGRLVLAPQLPGLNDTQIGDLLGLDCPTTIDNEMRAALVGEHWVGAAAPYVDSVYFGVGEGVGAALMIRGQVFGGHTGAAGEIGYLSPNGPLVRPTFGELGPLERLAGATALAERGTAVVAANPHSLLATRVETHNRVTPEIISQAASDGDPLAISLLEDEAAILAQAIATLSIILDPQAVIIGGGIALAGAVLIEPVQRRVDDLVPGRPPIIVQGQLRDEAAAIGAIRLAVTGSDATIETELRGTK